MTDEVVKKLRKRRSKDKWAKVNPRNKGKLREYIEHRYGKSGFNQDGTIKRSVIDELRHEKGKIHAHTRHEAQFAHNINE